MLFDAHLHFDGELDLSGSLKYFNDFMKEYSIDKAIVLSYCGWPEINDTLTSNFKSIWLKKMMPEKIFAYMSLRYDRADFTAGDYLEMICDGIKMGFDGVKFLNGKPDLRKNVGVSLSDKRYDLAFEKIERENIPVVYHVADPEYFWHNPKAYCYYGDGSFLTKQQLYNEVDELLEKFPNLRITFAHFYFLAAELERAADFLDRHPNVCFDLAPGREMFLELAKDIPSAREFFKKYKERIVWGSDVQNSLQNDGYNRDVYTLLNKVLSDGEPFYVIDSEFKPLGIDDDAMSYVKYKNQTRISGEKPLPVCEEAVRECIVKFSRENNALSEKDAKEFTQIARDFGVEI